MPIFNEELIEEAVEGFQEFSRRFAAIAEEEPSPLESTLRFLKSIPAGDTPKKNELSKFFQSEAGSSYTREERKAAYDELLGRERNEETIG